MNSDNSKNDFIGPALPPHLQKKSDCAKGPELPSNLQNSDANKTNLSTITNEIKIIGPALPPHLLKLPSTEENTANDIEITQKEVSSKLIVPVLSPNLSNTHEEEEEEEYIYGPMPVGATQSKVQQELEERALQMKIERLNPTENIEPTREEWMLELPAAKAANLGLGPRQFRTKAAPDLSDRSSWTDTPEDKAKKKNKNPQQDLQKETELRALKRRDEEQEAMAKKHKRNKESLVDMHLKKIKKQDESGPSERRPFSREVDLKVNRFDDAQKKAVLKKAQLLDTRFSQGASKFL